MATRIGIRGRYLDGGLQLHPNDEPASSRDEAYQEWRESTHPMPHSFAQAVTYWINRRRQLERCQTNHPRSYETSLCVNQSAEGSGRPPNHAWDNARTTVPTTHDPSAGHATKYTITEEDVDRQCDIAAPDRRSATRPSRTSDNCYRTRCEQAGNPRNATKNTLEANEATEWRKRLPLEQDLDNRTGKRLLPEVTRNAEIFMREEVEHTYAQEMIGTP